MTTTAGPIIFVSNFGKNRLYHNNHDGTFTDVAEKAGVTLGNWSTGVDLGRLRRRRTARSVCRRVPALGLQQSSGEGRRRRHPAILLHVSRREATACGPRGLKGEPDHLFHNNGDGTFTDVSEKAGVADKPGYYGLGAVFVDINNDGKPDLLVGNDSTPNYLYLNKGDGTFEDVSYASGYALNEAGRETASMGIAVGDYREQWHARCLQHHFL